MRNNLRLAIAATLALAAAQAGAIDLGNLQASFDGSRSMKYPNGDKPQVSCPAPTGLTETNVGNGGGEFCESVTGPPATLDFNGFGTSSIQNSHIAYKSLGTGDFQITACFESGYAGNLQPLTALGIGVRNDTTNTSYFAQLFSPYAWNSIINFNYGTTAADVTNITGSAGQTRTRCGALTYDKSENDLRGWESADGSPGSYAQVAQIAPPALAANPLGYAFGDSKDAVAPFQGTISNLAFDTSISSDIYTPAPPGPPDPPNTAPTCSAIGAQSGTQGQAFSLNVGSACSDAEGDVLSYAASNLSGKGLSIDPSTGIISGTPNATAVSASPFTSVVTVSDPADAATQVSVQFTFTSSTGDTIHWTTAMSNTRTCAQLGAGPGDTVIIDGTGGTPTRANLVIQNCMGTPSAYITFKNDATKTGPLTFNGSTTWGIQIKDSRYISIDGTDKWSGASAEVCGVDPNESNRMLPPTGARQCGIKLSGGFQSAIKRSGDASFITLKGIEIAGNGTSSGIRSGVAANDHQTKLSGVTQAQCVNGTAAQKATCASQWQEGWVMTNLYCHDTFSECFYIGSNANSAQIDDYPLRNNEISWSYVEDAGWDGISQKSHIDGSTGYASMHDNYVDGSGISESPAADGNSGACMDIFEGGYVNIYNNVLRNCHGPGFVSHTNNRAASFGPIPYNFYNNVIWHVGLSSTHGKGGFAANRKSTSVVSIVPNFYNNTIVDSPGTAVVVDANLSGCVVRDSIAAGNQTITATSCSKQGNVTGSLSGLNFVNQATGDVHLSSTSSACNAATRDGTPPTDIDGNSRPLDSHNDVGADEAAACPTN